MNRDQPMTNRSRPSARCHPAQRRRIDRPTDRRRRTPTDGRAIDAAAAAGADGGVVAAVINTSLGSTVRTGAGKMKKKEREREREREREKEREKEQKERLVENYKHTDRQTTIRRRQLFFRYVHTQLSFRVGKEHDLLV
jgi:hypothetical protein